VASWYASAADEARAMQRAAVRSGCAIKTMHVRDTGNGPHAVTELECPDGWAAARLLLAAAIEDSQTAGARDLALALRQNAPSDDAYARLLHQYVKDSVRFVRESGEIFQGPAYTLAMGAGDCDDQARLLVALGLAGGLGAQMGYLHQGEGPTHVAGRLCTRNACSWAETTVDAAYGEEPLAAARRTGVLNGREDINASQVKYMSERDLGPIPPGFVERNPPAVVQYDGEALARLGYLGASPATLDPTDPVFREAVLAFQLASGLSPDGLIGPHTRSAILNHLAADDFSRGYRQTMGALVGPTKLTAYLSDNFFRGVVQMAKDFQARGAGVTAQDFLAVWKNESDVNPASIGHEDPNYRGLNQMGAQERAAVGFPGSADDWVALSAEAQLPFVRRYYETDVRSNCRGDFTCLADVGSLYLINYLPAFMPHAKDPSFVLARPGGGFYDKNKGLDVGQKGYIEVADMAKVANRAAQGAKWNELVARLAAVGDTPPPSLLVANVLGLLFVGGVAALAAWQGT
jgi:hypothetical protein